MIYFLNNSIFGYLENNLFSNPFFFLYYHHFKFKRKYFHIISVLLTVYFKVKENRGRRDRDHMVVGIITTCVISAYHR